MSIATATEHNANADIAVDAHTNTPVANEVAAGVAAEAVSEVVSEVAKQDTVAVPVTSTTEKRKRKPRASKPQSNNKSLKKQAAIRENLKITAWQIAAKQHGFITPGQFRKIPKKGTPEYDEIKSTQANLFAEWTANGGEIPEKYRLHTPAIETIQHQEAATAAPVPTSSPDTEAAPEQTNNDTETNTTHADADATKKKKTKRRKRKSATSLDDQPAAKKRCPNANNDS